MYGDPEMFDLKAALARASRRRAGEHHRRRGIDGLLGLLVRLLVAPGPCGRHLGRRLSHVQLSCRRASAGGVSVPYRGDHEDPEALLASRPTGEAPLIYLANPDNPMGSWHGAADRSD